MGEPNVKAFQAANRERIRAYLRTAGLESLEGREDDVERAIHDLVATLSAGVAPSDPRTAYEYPVPMLSEDGTCSVVDEMAPVPYDLTAILGGRSDQTTRRLRLLGTLVHRARETTGAEWVGVYQRRANGTGAPVLVKLAYVGRPSRAEFPLTREFAERSTNSTVGLTGRATVIDNVTRHVEAGGGFYVCDDGIQSEACVPILDESRNVIGIIDAEARPTGFFGAGRLAVVAALAMVSAPLLP